jgi:hypothetical protein
MIKNNNKILKNTIFFYYIFMAFFFKFNYVLLTSVHLPKNKNKTYTLCQPR